MRKTLAYFTAACLIVAVTLTYLSGLHIDRAKWLAFILPAAASSLVLAAYARRCGFTRIQAVAEILFFHVLLLFPVTAAAYMAMHLNVPLADRQLAIWDAAIGFDWTTTIRFIDDRPWLASLLGTCYTTFTPQLLLYPLLLAAMAEPARGYRMLLAYALIVIVSSICAIPFPAVGTYAAAGIESMKNINLQLALDFVGPLRALKSDPNYVLQPDRIAGIISFPSVHAAVAVLCAATWWHNRLLRYPILLLNILMAMSAIPDGGHYLVDVIAGIALATMVIAFVNGLSLRLERQPGPLPLRQSAALTNGL